ncbi:hypothetical protein VTN77DRAFT_7657 [Rasamsonia byssochlamydoides]|uniref:uncharacterized protein n=1 Tax=Rasamsonia byssochlamydoides TaxID=89139 RepID=UPI003742EEC8
MVTKTAAAEWSSAYGGAWIMSKGLCFPQSGQSSGSTTSSCKAPGCGTLSTVRWDVRPGRPKAAASCTIPESAVAATMPHRAMASPQAAGGEDGAGFSAAACRLLEY